MLNQFLTTQNLLCIPVFLVIITVLVAAHEYGHYLFARIFGMGVEEFAIGFGRRPLWIYGRKKYLIPVDIGQDIGPRLESLGMHGELSSLDRRELTPVVAGAMLEGGLERSPADETMIIETANGSALEETTRFTIRPLPLGGFVRIKGMLPEADGSETRIPGGFYSKPPWQRFIVLLAGPVFSVIAGCILIFLLFATVGKPLQSPKPVLGVVASGSPAEAAGLKAGDRILSIDAKPIATFYDMIVIVRDPANPHHTIVYQRAGQQYTTQVIAEPDKTTSVVLNSDLEDTDVYKKQAKIGAGPSDDFIYRRVPLGQAFSEAFSTPAKALAMLGKLVLTPARLADNVGGPITMISETRKAVAHGPADVIGLAGLLSISVGILNLLPIPPLDGGQMAIAVAEMFRRGRRLSMKVQNWAAASGFLIVALLMIFVLSIDVSRLGTQEKPKFSDRDKYTSPNK